MPATTTVPKKLTLPADVLAFAEERGLGPYLPEILEVLHRVFADATQVMVEVHDDPEEAGLRCILFEVVVPWSKEQRRTGMKAWHRETAAICPAPLRPSFCLITYRRP